MKSVEEINRNETALVWFTNNLRVHDNPALNKACDEFNSVLGVYFFDPRHFEETQFGFKKTERYRAKFLLQTVSDLLNNLQQLGIPLLVIHGKPEEHFSKIVSEYSVSKIFHQKEWTQEETSVLLASQNIVPNNVIWESFYDQFLYHPEDIPFEVEDVPRVFTAFRKKVEKYAFVRELKTPIKPKLENSQISSTTTLLTLTNLGLEDYKTHEHSAFPFQGGESIAMERLNHYFWGTENLSQYKETRNGLLGTDYSSKFSPWLANGSISPRTIYHLVKQYEKEVSSNSSTYWLIFELIWRDFFKYVSLKHGNRLFHLGGILDKDYDWDKSSQKVTQWIEGKTREPFVNANMIELKETGWMSNRGRQNVASYFAKNQELDWRIGAAYFESMLIDYDVHSNYGNWQYLAGVGNDPRDRKFNIKSQAERYDPNQEFQDQWLNKKELA